MQGLPAFLPCASLQLSLCSCCLMSGVRLCSRLLQGDMGIVQLGEQQRMSIADTAATSGWQRGNQRCSTSSHPNFAAGAHHGWQIGVLPR